MAANYCLALQGKRSRLPGQEKGQMTMVRKAKATISDAELQDTEFWESEAVEQKPSRNRRAIVSVAFSQEEFAKVASTAKALNKRTSEFIREATLSLAVGSNSYACTLRWGAFHVENGTAFLSEEDAFDLATKAQTVPVMG